MLGELLLWLITSAAKWVLGALVILLIMQGIVLQLGWGWYLW